VSILIDNPNPAQVRRRALFRKLQERSARNRIGLYLFYKKIQKSSEAQRELLKKFNIKEIPEFWHRETIVPIADEWERKARYGQPFSKKVARILCGIAEEMEDPIVELGGVGVLAHGCQVDLDDARFKGRACVALTGFLKPADNGLWDSSTSAAGAKRILVSIGLGAARREWTSGVEAILRGAEKAVARSEKGRGSKSLGSERQHSGRERLIDNPDLFAAIWIRRSESVGKMTAHQGLDEVVPGAPSELVTKNLQRSLREFEQGFVTPSPWNRVESMEHFYSLGTHFGPIQNLRRSVEKRWCTLFVGSPQRPHTWTELMLGQDEGKLRQVFPWLFASKP
jgi:hypothetical protein